MAKEIERLSLLDISPPSITGDKNVQHLITAIDPELWNVSQSIREAFIISRLDELPEDVLDLLAWQWHVDFYELAHSVEAKREMVKKSIIWHKKKGTEGAILDALAMLGVEARFTAWYESGADPYTFAIDAKLTGDFWERVDWTQPAQTVRRAILQSKAARSWISRLHIYQEADDEQGITVGTATGQAYYHDVAHDQKTHSPASLLITTGAGMLQQRLHDVVIIWAQHSSTNSDILVTHGLAQGAHHKVAFTLPPRSSIFQHVSAAGAVHQKPQHAIDIARAHPEKSEAHISAVGLVQQTTQHEINIAQPHSAKAETHFSTGGIVACGIYTHITMAA